MDDFDFEKAYAPKKEWLTTNYNLTQENISLRAQLKAAEEVIEPVIHWLNRNCHKEFGLDDTCFYCSDDCFVICYKLDAYRTTYGKGE